MKRFLFLLFLPFLTISFAQKKKAKFGKIDKADFSWDTYQLDSNAHAVILYDYGDAELFYEPGQGDFFIRLERHTRIKILDKAGATWADQIIPLWETNNNREKLSKFKAATYNFADGKITETKVDKKDLLDERFHDNQVNKKIAMPDIKDGSIIELEYTTISPFVWNFVDWQFQYSIPVQYSEFNTSIPEWFYYNKQFRGYDLDYLTVNEESTGNDAITFTNFSRSGTYSVSSNARTERIDYTEKRNKWVAENMPALQAEPYTSNINNYMVQVDFELSTVALPNSSIQNYTNTWEEINKTLLESTSFGDQMKGSKSKFLDSTIKDLIKNTTTDAEKVAILYEHLKEKVLWNKRFNKYTSQSLKDTYSKGKGNVADVNLLLLAMLTRADIVANPVILSTKDNGLLNPYFPSSRQFNYVIVQATIGGKKYLLDATEKDLPMELLPVRCYNDKGRLIIENATDWIDLTPTASYGSVVSLDLILNDNSQWSGTLKTRSTGYAASNAREKIKDAAEGKEIESIEDKFEFAQIEDMSIEDNSKVIQKGASITLDNVMDGGDLLYFNPMAINQIEENPFKLKERKYPIDFSYNRKHIFSAKYQVPDGYTIEETPEDVTYSLPEKAGFFSYSIKLTDGAINVIQQLRINKSFFGAEEYEALKQFYDLIVNKHAEQIVLKKKT